MPLPANYRGLLGCKTVFMNREQGESMLRCMLMERTSRLDDAAFRKMVEASPPASSVSFPWNVFIKRLTAARISVSTPVVMFVLQLCKSHGEIVLWAFTLAHISASNNYQMVMFDDFVGAFSDGVPEESEYSRVWDEQKKSREERSSGITDNWLDDFSVWPLKAETVPQS